MSPLNLSLFLLLWFAVVDTQALSEDPVQPTVAPVPPENDSELDMTPEEYIEQEAARRKAVLGNRLKETIKSVKQMQDAGNFVDQAVRTNFLAALYSMANASAITGQNVSRSAATLIRGFIQDSFNLVSISAYFPRLIFLDGPTQFIETLRLIRAGQLRIPQDMDSAIDTLINFAGQVRDSPISHNLGTPVLSFFPNIFRGAELLASEVVFNVFGWLVPLRPQDIAIPSLEGLWNRWDRKSSTTDRNDYDKDWQSKRNNNTYNNMNQVGSHWALLN